MKPLKPWEVNGMTYFHDEDGSRICTGARLGRQDFLPDNPEEKTKLLMERLRLYDGCYDEGGAYWGSPENIFCAYAENVQVFVRASSRTEAKSKVRHSIPGATFFK